MPRAANLWCVWFYSIRLAAEGFLPRRGFDLVLEATMGLFDNLNLGGMLRGALGEAEAVALPAVINAVLAKTQYHDLNGLVAALQKGGLNAQVQSWLGPGANLPISEDQLKAVLGNAQIQEFARHLGLPVDQTLKLLAQYLPDIVDKASPNGTIQSK
jgi:uncharacterized protein YidB (DUF937 family)